MTFDEMWSQVKRLPEEAKRRIPETLKEDTKKRLSRKKPEEVASIVTDAIEEVNHGVLFH